MASYTIVIPKFLTHCRRRDPPKSGISKSKKSAYWKMNYNGLYGGTLHPFERSYIMDQLHKYLDAYFPKTLEISTPIEIEIHIYVPINYGSLSIRKNAISQQYELCWKKPKDTYKPNWDGDNLSSIWQKIIIDQLAGKFSKGVREATGLIPDDTVEYVRKGKWEIHFVDNIEDRKIELIINEL